MPADGEIEADDSGLRTTQEAYAGWQCTRNALPRLFQDVCKLCPQRGVQHTRSTLRATWTHVVPEERLVPNGKVRAHRLCCEATRTFRPHSSILADKNDKRRHAEEDAAHRRGLLEKKSGRKQDAMEGRKQQWRWYTSGPMEKKKESARFLRIFRLRPTPQNHKRTRVLGVGL